MNKDTRFQKGNVPWNKGLSGFNKGEKNGAWKGNNVGYNGLHSWVRREKGTAEKCEQCYSNFKVEWANKSGEYKREILDWIALCSPCHRKYDKDRWGLAAKKFPNLFNKYRKGGQYYPD